MVPDTNATEPVWIYQLIKAIDEMDRLVCGREESLVIIEERANLFRCGNQIAVV